MSFSQESMQIQPISCYLSSKSNIWRMLLISLTTTTVSHITHPGHNIIMGQVILNVWEAPLFTWGPQEGLLDCIFSKMTQNYNFIAQWSKYCKILNTVLIKTTWTVQHSPLQDWLLTFPPVGANRPKVCAVLFQGSWLYCTETLGIMLDLHNPLCNCMRSSCHTKS